MDEQNGGTNGETKATEPEATAATNEARALQAQTQALRELLTRMRTDARDQSLWANEIEAIIGK